MTRLYFIFLITLILLSFFYSFCTSASIRNFLGEKAFLSFHQNKLATLILELWPNSSNQNFYTHFLLGRIYFVENELEKSIQSYNRSIVLNPTYKENYYGLGLSFGFLGSVFLNEAQTNFEKYIELENQEYLKTGRRAYGAWAGHNDLAWIHFLKGEFQETEKISLLALKFSEDNPWLLNMLATGLIEQGKCKEALPYLGKALFLADNSSIEEFGEAYSGDNKQWWPVGLVAMKNTIKDNINLCSNFNAQTR